MVNFASDYTEGAHPKVLERLLETNFQQTPGYGEDPYCEEARTLIREMCAAPEAEVQFLTGGTQANQTVIAAALRPYQGAVAADSGHIAVHEPAPSRPRGTRSSPSRGGRETHPQRHRGPVPGPLGRQLPGTRGAARPRLSLPGHRVGHGLQPSGAGSHRRGLPGVRPQPLCGRRPAGLRHGSIGDAPDYRDLARLCDCFTIGGTKVGALLGRPL